MLLFQSYFLTGQTIEQIDSITYKMCESLVDLKDVKEDVKITMIVQKHLPSFYQKFNVTTQTALDSIGDKVFFRLQKNCSNFVAVLNNLEESKGDWVILSQKPKSEISKNTCSAFFSGTDYYYKEYDGKIVNVVMTNNTWTETFEDKTTSKLVLHQKDNGEFELEFIESNNHLRKNLSIKGDRYNYGIFKLKENVYYLWTSGKDNKTFYSFRLYQKK